MRQPDSPFELPSWVIPRGDVTTGSRRAMLLRPGFGVSSSDVFHHREHTYRHIYEHSYLRLHYRLAGHTEIAEQGQGFRPVEPGNVTLLVHAADAPKYERIRGDQRERTVTLVCEREFAASMLDPSASGLPGFVRDFLLGKEQHVTFAWLPIAPQIGAMVEQILHPPLTGKLGELMLEAKALELLCFTMQQVADAPSSRSIKPRDLKRVKEVCSLLNDPVGGQMSVRELCRAVGWNETQLTERFKQVTGTTISNYRQQVRMEHARRRLMDSDASITEIALEAGYEHPSNFATAFKRAFGYPPTAARSHLRIG